jgi:hypothetical protein
MTMVHATVSYCLYLWSFLKMMDRFDTEASASFLEMAAFWSSKVLLSPLFYPAIKYHLPYLRWFPGHLGYVLVLLNSSIWVVAIFWIIRKLQRAKEV